MKVINLTRQEITLVIIFIFSIVFLAFMTVVGAEKQGLAEPIEVVVKEGDTIWGFATNYDHPFSVDEFIQWVIQANEMEESNLIAGQTLIIPVEKSSR
ncbi:LysM peptidoglycan-binding domain-containing protein [Alkalihalobacillus sp. BA299]|uniref:cell division suppressor protein YneA n=1 Tax=Alkalihalobacillus sp. BA299 TaxID=2815938 RepID=UPI001AD9C94E|nr:LysM peptidoglycan-binding domain-containing protein [Alkalihalobacillus sp. BA299]